MDARTGRLLALARRYIWWTAPERVVSEELSRLVAQVMELGTWEDSHELIRLLGADAFVAVLHSPPPGVLSPRSWTFWHHRLGLGEPPPPPMRFAARGIPPHAAEA